MTSPLDAAARLGLRGAYMVARAWWWVRRPRTSGALVALWHGDHLLLVRASYRPQHVSLPGGFVRSGEAPRQAALRELREELGVALGPDAVSQAWQGTVTFECRQDTVTIFEAGLATRPPVGIDRREIVWADWIARDDAPQLPLLPHVLAYIQGGAPRGTSRA